MKLWARLTAFRCARGGVCIQEETARTERILATNYASCLTEALLLGGNRGYKLTTRTRGVDNVVSTLRTLAEKFGGRFTPDAGWENFK